jgi:predicted DNA-binding transcriptional regulator AlpA
VATTAQSTYLSTDQVCARFGGVTRMWIYRAIRSHGFPSPLKFGDHSARGHAFYSLATVERWERIQANQPQLIPVLAHVRGTLVKSLGMLGNIHDGEIANAARMAERLRKKVSMAWEQPIIGATP